MSRENLQIVQRVIAAHEAGDIAAVFDAYDPAIEWDISRLPGGDFDPVYRGHDGVRAFWRRWFAAWETASFEYHEFVEAGDDVVSILSQRVRGRQSGVELEWRRYAQAWTVRDRKIVRVQFFASRAEALEALGVTGE